MSENETKNLNADSTNPLPFEEYVRTTLTVVLNQLSGLETRFDGLETRFDGLETKVINLQAEVRDGFFELGRQVKDLDRKVDIFIKEQLYLKDEWRELRDAQKPRI